MPMMPGYVDGPPAQPQRGGLLPACFEGPVDKDDHGTPLWFKGAQDWPENAAAWRLVADYIASGTGADVTVDYGVQDNDDPYPVAARPVMLQVKVTGPKLGRTDDLRNTLRGRVERRLDAVASQAIAHELWAGTLTQQAAFPLPTSYGWANPETGSLTTPAGLSAVASTTGGTLASGTYYYRVSATNAQGETLAAAQVSATTTGATGSVALTWTAVSGASGYQVYRSTTSGSWAGPALLASPASNSYTDTGAATVSAGAPAASDTATSGMWTNPYLSDPLNVNDVTPGDPLTPMRALGAIEAATGELVAGGPVLIHVPLEVLPEISWSLERTGPLLTTSKGSIVVPDQGYPGFGPGETESTATPSTYMYGSGPVMYWLGDNDVIDNLDSVVSASDNSVAMWGQRPFMTLFDPRTLTGCAVTPSTP